MQSRPAAGWSTISVGGKPVDVFVPKQPAEHPSAVLYLHGHGLLTLKGNEVYTTELDRRGLYCACPFGGRAWWGKNRCSDFDPAVSPRTHLAEAVLPWMAETWKVTPPGIALLGVSMGGQGALRMSYDSPCQFPTVAALAPAIDFHRWYGQGLPLDELYPNREAARQDTVILHLNPLNWPRNQFIACDPTDADWFDGVDRLAMKLSSSGVPFERELELQAGGHSWDYFNSLAARVMEFLDKSLERERNRLPVTNPFKSAGE
jgi:acetyl esterase/lipase